MGVDMWGNVGGMAADAGWESTQASLGGELGPFGGDGVGGWGADGMPADGGFSNFEQMSAQALSMGFSDSQASGNAKNMMLAAGVDHDEAVRGFTAAGTENSDQCQERHNGDVLKQENGKSSPAVTGIEITSFLKDLQGKGCR